MTASPCSMVLSWAASAVASALMSWLIMTPWSVSAWARRALREDVGADGGVDRGGHVGVGGDGEVDRGGGVEGEVEVGVQVEDRDDLLVRQRRGALGGHVLSGKTFGVAHGGHPLDDESGWEDRCSPNAVALASSTPVGLDCARRTRPGPPGASDDQNSRRTPSASVPGTCKPDFWSSDVLGMTGAPNAEARQAGVMDATRALERLGGTASTKQLLRLTTRRRLRSAVRTGRIEQRTRGRYALPTATDARKAAAALTAVVCLRSAAAHYGWELKTQPRVP